MRGPAARVYLKIVRSTSPRKRLRPTRAYIRPGGRVTSRNRIKTYVRGFDDVLNGGIPEGYVVLVSGAPGTMKSSLTYSILYQNALQESRKSAYFTLEQGKDLILEHMASMAMADPRAAEQIVTLDMGNIRKNLSYLQGRGTWLELFKMYCKNVMKADLDVLQERDEGRSGFGPRGRLARRPRDDGEDARPPDRTLLPLRVAARPRPLDVPDLGETPRPRGRRLVARRGIPGGWDLGPRDAFDVRSVRTTSPAGREDARHEARYGVLRVLVRRRVVRGDTGRQRDGVG